MYTVAPCCYVTHVCAELNSPELVTADTLTYLDNVIGVALHSVPLYHKCLYCISHLNTVTLAPAFLSDPEVNSTLSPCMRLLTCIKLPALINQSKQ